MEERTCIICDAPLNDRQKLACSQRCRMKHYWTTPEGAAAKARAQAKYAPPKRHPCSTCGTPTEDQVCWRCTHAAHPHDRRQRKLKAAQRKLDRSARGTEGRRPFTMGRCHYCGETFTNRSHVPVRFCSRRCLDGDKSARYRARSYDVWIEEINRSSIFRRHGWQCHICNTAIDQSLPANDPMSATLDHVIPLIGRGPHCEANLRPAHMMCNSLKSMDEAGVPILAA